jgi:hypothetical protein
MIKKHQQNITGFIIKAYYAYFGVKLGDDKSRAPHKVCYVCVDDLRKTYVKRFLPTYLYTYISEVEIYRKKESHHIWCPNDMEGATKSQ